MKNKHSLKLFVLGLTFAAVAVSLLRLSETNTAARKQESLLADNVWTGAAGHLWNTTDGNWTNPTVWNNATPDCAIFSGPVVGSITTTTPITLRGMRFDVNGYNVTMPGALTFVNGAGCSLAPGEIQVANGVSVEVNNKFSGTVGMTKTGGGTLILNNTPASDYTGPTTISGGKLQLGVGVNGSNQGTVPNNPISLAPGSTLDFRRGLIDLNFSGQVTAANGSTLVKSGLGTVTLSANGNTLADVTISSGTLNTTGTGNTFSNVSVNGGIFNPSSGSIAQLSVSSGALKYGGNIQCGALSLSGGTLEMGCNIASPYPLNATGGTISPGGQGTVGMITANTVSLNPATTMHIEIDGGLGPDQLTSFATASLPVNNINLGGAQLTGTLINGFNPTPGQQFIIAQRGGSAPGVGSISGQFAQGSQVTLSGRRFSITYTNSTVTLTALSTSSPFDFDGDSKTDIGIYRPSNSEWWYQRSSDNQVAALTFGTPTDRIVPADYTGDGKTDIAFWRPSTGEWFVLRSENNTYYAVTFGLNGDAPAPGDFDNDGKADVAVFRPSSATWFISGSAGGIETISFGQNGDVPTVDDFDGDGRADIAIFRPSNGQWWLRRSTLGVIATTFGVTTDKPVVGRHTADNRADIAFWRPSTGEWFVLRSEDFSYYSAPFGTNGDIPTPGDYDGDGRFDTAVFRPSNQNWYINRTTSGLVIQQFGQASDKPVPSAFIP